MLQKAPTESEKTWGIVSLEHIEVGTRVRVVRNVCTEGFWERAGVVVTGEVRPAPDLVVDKDQVRTHINVFPDAKYPAIGEFTSQHPIWFARVPVVDTTTAVIECNTVEILAL